MDLTYFHRWAKILDKREKKLTPRTEIRSSTFIIILKIMRDPRSIRMNFLDTPRFKLNNPLLKTDLSLQTSKVIHDLIPLNETTRGYPYWRISISTSRGKFNLTFQTHGWTVPRTRLGTRLISPSTFISSNPFDPWKTSPKISWNSMRRWKVSWRRLFRDENLSRI